MPEEELQKPSIIQPTKSSMEILSELFSTFDAEPPLIIKKEKDDTSKKHKKNKKKHKHKEKKHKKKGKKRKRNDSSCSEHSELDLAALLIKRERQSPEKKIKLESSNFLETLCEKINKQETKENPSKDLNKNDKTETKTEENNDRKDNPSQSTKIIIKDLKSSSVFEQTLQQLEERTNDVEDGELSSDDSTCDNRKKEKHKRKHKHSPDEKSKKRKHSHQSHNKDKHKHLDKSSKKGKDDNLLRSSKDKDDNRSKLNQENKEKCNHHRIIDKHKIKDKHRDEYNEKSKDSYYKDKNDKHKYYDDIKHHKNKENPFYKEDSTCKYKDDSYYKRSKDYKWYRTEYDREREPKHREKSSSRDRDRDTHIDKKKLLEIARRNAIQMMKSGSLPAALTLGPHAQEKVIAAIRAGGKTIEELTDFCKSLSRKEELGELSSVSGDEHGGNESDLESKAFHHPFQLKDRPTAIVMNIKNSVPLPTKTPQERSAELRIQFPVSSGTQHRKTEKEWVPVSPKKAEVVPVVKPPISEPEVPVEAPAMIPAPPAAPPGPQVFPIITNTNIDIGSIVSQRLSAMRKLQENPYDVEALNEIHKSQRQMQNWAESKQQPGQFTGSTGAQILSQAELASGYQAWAKKDQLQNAAPVSGGMGMHLLKKMGWNPGEGLGKDRTGALEPLLLEVKLDKKGLVANEEQQRRKQQKIQKITVKTLEGKHPVSLLGEYTAKKKLGAPEYILCMESGPDHKKMFLFKVIVNGLEYQPEAASPNKKQAKADAAKLCLQNMGVLVS